MTHSDDIDLSQEAFDPMGPVVHSATLTTGRTVSYIDDGEPTWQPLVFFGGAGTTVRAFRLFEFARTLRRQLRIRVVSVERNGLGQTAFDPFVGYTEHATDVWALLDVLGITQASISAVSGGGPYAAHVAAAQPQRVRSLHLACAFAENLDGHAFSWSAELVAADPIAWWQFPPESAVHRIPGFTDSAIEEATRGTFARSRDTPPEGLRQAFEFYRDSPLLDLSSVTAPAFLYWGTDDQLVCTAHLDRWQSALPRVSVIRRYAGEGHDVQYRHWDQILADVAHLGDRTVISLNGRNMLVSLERADVLLADGAVLGLGAWREQSPTALRPVAH